MTMTESVDLWTSLASGLVGSVVGAVVGAATTWFVTRDSINKQFENQMAIANMQELEKKHVALVSLMHEAMYNHDHLDQLQRFYQIDPSLTPEQLYDTEKDFGIKLSFQTIKWEKHSDTLFNVLSAEETHTVSGFYRRILLISANEVISKDLLDRSLQLATESVHILGNLAIAIEENGYIPDFEDRISPASSAKL